MISVRRNTFETNSSSTHSLTICSQEEYDSLGRNTFIDIEGGGVFSKQSTLDYYDSLKDNKYTKEVPSKDEVDLLWDVVKEHIRVFENRSTNDDLQDLTIWDYTSEINEICENYKLDEKALFPKYHALTDRLKGIFNDFFLNLGDLDLYDEINAETGLEDYSESYITKNGDKIIAFGYYGYPY